MNRSYKNLAERLAMELQSFADLVEYSANDKEKTIRAREIKNTLTLIRKQTGIRVNLTDLRTKSELPAVLPCK